MSNDGSLDIVKLRLAPRFDVPFSIWSEAYLVAIPVVGVVTIHPTRANKTPIMMAVESNATNHSLFLHREQSRLAALVEEKKTLLRTWRDLLLFRQLERARKTVRTWKGKGLTLAKEFRQ